jgi:hypothetical protein
MSNKNVQGKTFRAEFLYRDDGNLLTEIIEISATSRTAAMRIARSHALRSGRRLFQLSDAVASKINAGAYVALNVEAAPA